MAVLFEKLLGIHSPVAFAFIWFTKIVENSHHARLAFAFKLGEETKENLDEIKSKDLLRVSIVKLFLFCCFSPSSIPFGVKVHRGGKLLFEQNVRHFAVYLNPPNLEHFSRPHDSRLNFFLRKN